MPSTRSVPALTGEVAPSIRIAEDFPAPLGPRKPKTSPRPNSKSISVDGAKFRHTVPGAIRLREAPRLDQERAGHRSIVRNHATSRAPLGRRSALAERVALDESRASNATGRPTAVTPSNRSSGNPSNACSPPRRSARPWAARVTSEVGGDATTTSRSTWSAATRGSPHESGSSGQSNGTTGPASAQPTPPRSPRTVLPFPAQAQQARGRLAHSRTIRHRRRYELWAGRPAGRVELRQSRLTPAGISP
jgi:hypothetical protein